MTMVVENNGHGPLDRQAAVLADIQKMHMDFQAAREEIAQLKSDLHREEDRVALLIAEKERIIEENKKERAGALIIRDKLVELATAMANIGLLTVSAQEIMQTVHEMTKGEKG